MTSQDADLCRSFVLLSDESRFVRGNALKTLKKYLSTKNGEKLDIQLLNQLANHLPIALNDSTESNREIAVEILGCIIDSPDFSSILPTVIPVLVQRLGQKEIIESSEELRLLTLNIVHGVVKNSVDTNVYVDDFLTILHHTLVDTYPEMKKLSCEIIINLSSKKCHRFYQTSEIILAPILSNLVHQHSKVRFETVRALGVFMLHSQGKHVDSVIAPLTQRLFDPASIVRRCVIEVVGSWLLDLPDRYSYQTKLLPLLLSGFIDESKEIRNLTEGLWHDIGIKFQKENEEQLKDKLDFDSGPPSGYPVGFRRPNLGCRELVYRSASRLLPPLCRDLGDWQEATRVQASGLIPILILHLEEATTQHTQHLISGLAAGLSDAISRTTPANAIGLMYILPSFLFRYDAFDSDDKRNGYGTDDGYEITSFVDILSPFHTEKCEPLKVIKQLLLSTQIMGCLVSVKLWWHLLEPCLRKCSESNAPSSLAGHLFFLSGILSGSPSDQLNCTAVDKSINADDDNYVNDSVKVVHHLTDQNGATINNGTLNQIVNYLRQDELISVMSFTNKAALLECVNVVVSYILRFTTKQDLGTCSTNPSIIYVNKDVAIPQQSTASWAINEFDICSSLFQILLGLCSIWSGDDARSSDFSVALLNLTDRAIKQLAVCYKNCSKTFVDQTLLPIKTDGDNIVTSDSKASCAVTFNDIDRAISAFIPKLLDRLSADLDQSGSWHPNSVGLAIFARCLQVSGRALLMKFTHSTDNSDPDTVKSPSSNNQELLTLVLDLMERGCRLNCAPGLDKSPNGSDPLTISSEAELRLRGLLILIQLTDIAPIRQILTSTQYLTRCLDRLILPVCVWRAGRTSEAMRKAAVTCLIPLLAASTSIYSLDKIGVDIRRPFEIKLDHWLCNSIDCVKQLLGQKFIDINEQSLENTDDRGRKKRISSLTTLPASCLSLLLARLGSLLDDDLEGTRQMACLGLTLLFDGLSLPTGNDQNNNQFFNSPTWLMHLNKQNTPMQEDLPSLHPMPNSFGDQIYRFYPNLIKRLNDSKDKIRLLISETINSWLRLLLPMLTNKSIDELSTLTGASVNLHSIHNSVMSDFIQGVLIHLDDSNGEIRGAIARIVARLYVITPDQMESCLIKAKESYRYADLCDQLLTLNGLRFC